MTADLLDQVRLAGNNPDNSRAWNSFQLSEIKDLIRRLKTVKTLLPYIMLTVSHCTIKDCTITNHITYNISTVSDISELCLLYTKKKS